jgi:non-specific serine/threonine protein kinase
MERWTDDARAAARLSHPRLAPVVEMGVHQRLPFVAYARSNGPVLAERLDPRGQVTMDVGRWASQLLEGLAFAHDAGLAHRDLQLHAVQLNDRSEVQLLGLCVAPEPRLPDHVGPLQVRHALAERDLLAVGLLMHHLLAARAALDEPDLSRAVERLTPYGDATVQLPLELPLPVPDAFRAIVNRCLAPQSHQRFRHARTMARALESWVPSQHSSSRGELPAQLLDRARRHGALPALPDGAALAAKLMAMERRHVGALTLEVLQDPALCFELLRQANSASVRSVQQPGSGAVLTVRRAITLVGMEGVQRAVQLQQPWPGPLDEASAQRLLQQVVHTQHSARLAQLLNPGRYDTEIVYIVTMLQQLGSLLLHYHFPDLALQICLLMAPPPMQKEDEPAVFGMDEATAAQTVLGLDLSALSTHVVKQWGLEDSMLQVMCRLPLDQPVRVTDSDELLRAVASAACEAVHAHQQPSRLYDAAVDRVAQRYGHVLRLDSAKLRLLLRQSEEPLVS